MSSSHSIGALPYVFVENNLRVLSDCKEGNKLRSSSDGKIEKEMRALLVTAQRAWERAFEPQSIRETYLSAQSIVIKGRGDPYSHSMGISDRNNFMRISSSIGPSFGGLLELIDTYAAEGKGETVEKLEGIYEEVACKFFTLKPLKELSFEEPLPDFLAIHNIKLLSTAKFEDRIFSFRGRLIKEGESSLIIGEEGVVKIGGESIEVDSMACAIAKTYREALEILSSRAKEFTGDREPFRPKVKKSLSILEESKEYLRNTGQEEFADFLESVCEKYLPKLEEARGTKKVSSLIERFGGGVKKNRERSFAPEEKPLRLEGGAAKIQSFNPIKKLSPRVEKELPPMPLQVERALFPLPGEKMVRAERKSSLVGNKVSHLRKNSSSVSKSKGKGKEKGESSRWNKPSVIRDFIIKSKKNNDGEAKLTILDQINMVYYYFFPLNKEAPSLSKVYEGGKFEIEMKAERVQKSKEAGISRFNQNMVERVKIALIDDYDPNSTAEKSEGDFSWSDVQGRSPPRLGVDSTLRIVDDYEGGAKGEKVAPQKAKLEPKSKSRSLYAGGFKNLLEQAERERQYEEVRKKLQSIRTLTAYSGSNEEATEDDFSVDEAFEEENPDAVYHGVTLLFESEESGK